MSDKTKATLQGRQSINNKNNNVTKDSQSNRPFAGGQSLSDMGIPITGTTGAILRPLISLGFLTRHSQRNFASADLTQFFGSSLAFLRWRRFISPFAAVTRKLAVLSPGSFSCSMSSITSCGIRTVVICDFAFFAPVAIAGSPCDWCMSVYAKKMTGKGLKCISLKGSLKNEGDIHLISAKPGSAPTLTGPLTKPLVEVTVMAETQHTQTHPKFTWRFLAVPVMAPDTKPIVLYTNATSEQTARDNCPGWMLFFAARLPVQEVKA